VVERDPVVLPYRGPVENRQAILLVQGLPGSMAYSLRSEHRQHSDQVPRRQRAMEIRRKTIQHTARSGPEVNPQVQSASRPGGCSSKISQSRAPIASGLSASQVSCF
jgi:hypothetical protein